MADDLDGEDEVEEAEPASVRETLLAPAHAPTGSPRPLTPAEEAELAEEPLPEHVERPRTRGDCKDGTRPCPFVGCRFSLYLHVSEKTGAIKLAFPGLEVDEMGESCALDVADRGGHDQHVIADMLNVSRARADQIEDNAIRTLKRRAVNPHDD